MSSKRSRIHPKYKTKYTVTNWPTYDRSLVRRGDVTFWLSPDAIAGWDAKPAGRRGGQQKYSNLAIETALTLRLVFHLPLRQAEGFLGSLFKIMDVDLDVPDHTTLSRRGQRLDVDHCIPRRKSHEGPPHIPEPLRLRSGARSTVGPLRVASGWPKTPVEAPSKLTTALVGLTCRSGIAVT